MDWTRGARRATDRQQSKQHLLRPLPHGVRAMAHASPLMRPRLAPKKMSLMGTSFPWRK